MCLPEGRMKGSSEAGRYRGREAAQQTRRQRGRDVVSEAGREAAQHAGRKAGREALHAGQVGLGLRVQLHQARNVRPLQG